METKTGQRWTGGRPRIVIAGGGFGGAYAAKFLKSAIHQFDADVLLLDRNNYFIFYPLLVEAGTGSLEARHAVVPIRQFLNRSSRFRMAETLNVDIERKQVVYRMIGEDGEHRADYDHLVLAFGSVTRMPPIPGLKEYAYEMKTLADSVALRDRAIQMLELANVTKDDTKRRALLHFVVVGSNFTGIEVAGEFHEYMREAAGVFRNIKPDECQVTIVERSERILSVLDEDLAEFAHKDLAKRGVTIRTKMSVKEVRETEVVLDSGEVIPSCTLVWCGGIAENPLVAKLPFPLDQRGYIDCERDLRVKGFDNVWAVGDCAAIRDEEGKLYAATAQNAMRMGKMAGHNITRALRGEASRPCNLVNQGSLAALGCRTAVAKVFGFKLSGILAWWMWRTVYLLKMPTLARKIRVAADWTVDLFFQRDFSQLGINRSAVVASKKNH
ncbi:NAD(P)/FAD-dependent oxidoreductase [Candidatus Sumerlaeota bacterium]|nr:NAD(P)/FAD-dependent oxidoreductase [Candidatus Sumerlaeota bacterium]